MVRMLRFNIDLVNSSSSILLVTFTSLKYLQSLWRQISVYPLEAFNEVK